MLAWFCVRILIVACGSAFSVFLLMLSHMESIHHESAALTMSHAASGAVATRHAAPRARAHDDDRRASLHAAPAAAGRESAAGGPRKISDAEWRSARPDSEAELYRPKMPPLVDTALPPAAAEPARPPPLGRGGGIPESRLRGFERARDAPDGMFTEQKVGGGGDDDAAPKDLSLEEILDTLSLFLRKVHVAFADARRAGKEGVWDAYVGVAERYLRPFERRFAKRTIVPVREDGSVFVSVAAYRDHMLSNTLTELFGNAASPDRVVAGVVMQNCAARCKTGVEVVSKAGEPTRTKVSDAPPDRDGVAEFCATPLGAPHCAAGRVRALRVNETESLGPAFARYLASKLWLGEHYYVQIDAHMWTVDGWDEDLRKSLRAAPSYPRVVMSAYPPGPDAAGTWKRSARNTGKLCGGEFSKSSVEAHIFRLGSGGGRGANYAPAPEPPRSVYVGAGFFAAHASFLGHLPFDPYLPFVFMGEEIALTTRFYTNGYDVYAPRESLFAHQYRPGRMGLPKFWESTDRTFGAGGSNTNMMLMIVDRVKHVVGYPAPPKNDRVLAHLNDADGPNYGLGDVRPLSAFLDMASLDMAAQTAGYVGWCDRGEAPPPGV